jgi:hypothetical protein
MITGPPPKFHGTRDILPILRGPLNWPWRHSFSRRLAELRAVHPAPG